MNTKLNGKVSRMERTIDLFDRLYKGRLTSTDEVIDKLKDIWRRDTIPVSVVKTLLEMSGYPDSEARWTEAMHKCLNCQRSNTYTATSQLPPGIQDEETAKRYAPYLRFGFDSKKDYERVRAIVEDAVADRIELQRKVIKWPKIHYNVYCISPEDLQSLMDSVSRTEGARIASMHPVTTWTGCVKQYNVTVETQQDRPIPPFLRTVR